MREWGDFRQSQSNAVEIRAAARVFFFFFFWSCPVHLDSTPGEQGSNFFFSASPHVYHSPMDDGMDDA